MIQEAQGRVIDCLGREERYLEFEFFFLLTVWYLAAQPFYSFPLDQLISPSFPASIEHPNGMGLRAWCEKKSQTRKQQIGTRVSVFGRR